MPLILTTKAKLASNIKIIDHQQRLNDEASVFYTEALSVAHTRERVALPLVHHTTKGLSEARKTIITFLEDHDLSVYLILEKHIVNIEDELKVQMDLHLAAEQNLVVESFSSPFHDLDMDCPLIFQDNELTLAVNRKEETFSQMLLRLIDEKGSNPVTIYKRANIDRKLFSKIKKNPDYQPSKHTAIALGIALELNYDQMLDLLGKAGYTLSHSRTFDLIIEFFIEKGSYDIFSINEALFTYDQQLLGL